jgi:hypothetical protein
MIREWVADLSQVSGGSVGGFSRGETKSNGPYSFLNIRHLNKNPKIPLPLCVSAPPRQRPGQIAQRFRQGSLYSLKYSNPPTGRQAGKRGEREKPAGQPGKIPKLFSANNTNNFSVGN